jgi:hypothetical protein
MRHVSSSRLVIARSLVNAAHAFVPEVSMVVAGCIQALRVAAAALFSLLVLASACAGPPEDPRNGLVGGRVLMAPGAGLANARVVVEQLDLFSDQPTRVLMRLGEATTDSDGYFEPIATQFHGGALLFRVQGGSFTDPISQARIQRDASAELRAVHWLELFEDRSREIYVTPVHSLIEARFRYKATISKNGPKSLEETYAHFNAHFGALDWRTVIPADVSQPAVSPTDEVRAVLLLGGLAVLADGARNDSDATPQAVNLGTLVAALEADLGDALLDGNDANALAAGTGLELSECPSRSGCTVRPSACQLGDCRPACSLYVNTLRTLLSQATAAFIGTRAFPSKWNRTTLGAEDARTLLDGIGRNPDPDLFGDACVETVDRMPPTIVWQSPGDEQVFFRGQLTISISASDDSGAGVRAYFPDLADEDGDLTNNVARTTLHPLVDGPITVIAAAIDPSGNDRRIQRTFEVDNLSPVISLDSAGYIVDARAWWTSSSASVLRGTVAEEHLKALTVLAGGVPLAVTRSGATWSATLPDGVVSASGTAITIRAEDLAGNVATRALTLRLDTTEPVFEALTTSVRDERADTVGFVGVTPTHSHDGPAVSLGGAGCPDVYKYGYLLDEQAPPYGGEIGSRNPLRWSLQLIDEGVGVDPATTQYRVRVAGTGGAVLRDWTPISGGDIGSGVRRFDLSLYRNGANGIAALGTTEGALEIDLRGKDLFGHEIAGTRCWTHHPLGAPVHVSDAYTPGTSGHPAHPLSLNAHGLESTRLQDLSSLLLNDDSTGASTMDSIISNGTAEVVYLRVALTAPSTASVNRTFQVVYEPLGAEPTDESCEFSSCSGAPAPISVTESFPAMPTPFEVRLYAADAAGAPVSLVAPCMEPGCINTATTRTYRLEARTSATAIPRYVATAWLKQATAFRPSNATYPASPPFIEFTLDSRAYTGMLMDSSYCTRTQARGIPRVTYCVERAFYKRRQSLASVLMTLETISDFMSASATATTTRSSIRSLPLEIPVTSYSTTEQ